MKKIIKVLLLIIITSCCAVSLLACDNTNTITNDPGIQYKLYSGEYIVTGFISYDSFDGVLEIPAEYNGRAVTEIASDAFAENTDITEIVIPTSVETIGSGIFAEMTSLTKVTIPYVGESATAVNTSRIFGYYFGSTSYVGGIQVTQNYSKNETSSNYYIPKVLAEVHVVAEEGYALSDYAFYGMNTLDVITLSEGIVSIGDSAFKGCAILEELVVPSTVTAIGDSAFTGCTELLTIDFTDSTLETIGEYAFQGLELTSFDMPNSVTYVGEGAFSDMEELVEVTISNSLKELRLYTFKGNISLTTIYFANVETIGAAFVGCTALEAVTATYATYVKAGAFKDCEMLSFVSFADDCVVEDGAFINTSMLV